MSFSMVSTVPAMANTVTKQSAKVRCLNKVVVLFFLILLSIRVLMARMFPIVDRITKPWGGKQQIHKI
jgi:hypothetical protein